METKSNIVLLTLIGLVTVLIFYIITRNLRRNKLLVKFRSPPALPFIGHTLYFATTKKEDLLKMFEKMCENFGSAVATWSCGQTLVILSDAKHLDNLFSETAHNLHKGFEYEYMRPWLGDGLLLSEQEKWSQRRKMLTPSFDCKMLEDFLPIMNHEGQKMAKTLCRKYGEGKNSFDIMFYSRRCTLDIICETAMGKPIEAQENEMFLYSDAVIEFGEMLVKRGYKPWYSVDFLWKRSDDYKRYQEILEIMHRFTNSVIKEKKELRRGAKEYYSSSRSGAVQKGTHVNVNEACSKSKKSFLDVILDVQDEIGENNLSDQDVREETDTFLFAGHDKISACLSFTMFALGNHQDVQEKVRKELHHVFGDDKERPVTTEDLSKLRYLECVIKESMRLYPPVPMIQRHLRSDLEIGDDLIIPKNVTVAVFIYKIHRDSKYYPDPIKFKPERWMEPAANKNPAHSFIPFSAGPRNCIGEKFAFMEAKTLLAILLRNLKIQSVQKPDEIKLGGELTLRSLNGLKLKVTTL